MCSRSFCYGSPRHVEEAARLSDYSDALLSLKHENVIAVTGVLLEGMYPHWIVTEPIRQCLQQHTYWSRLSQRQFWLLARDIAHGLAYLQTRGCTSASICDPAGVCVVQSPQRLTCKLLPDPATAAAAASAAEALSARPLGRPNNVNAFGTLLAGLILRCIPRIGCLPMNLDPAAVTPRLYADARVQCVAVFPSLAPTLDACSSSHPEIASFDNVLGLLDAVQPRDCTCQLCGVGFDSPAAMRPCLLTACQHSLCSRCCSGPPAVCPIPGCGRAVDRIEDDSNMLLQVMHLHNVYGGPVPPLSPVDDLVFVLLGPTGAGKSFTGCQLLGYRPLAWYRNDHTGTVVPRGPGATQGFPFPVASDDFVDSVTKVVCPFPGTLASGCTVTVVDTPGLDDAAGLTEASMSSLAICRQVLAWVQMCKKLTALLLFIRSNRTSKELLLQFALLELVFGPSIWNRVVFVFRHDPERPTSDQWHEAANVVEVTLATMGQRLDAQLERVGAAPRGPRRGARKVHPVLISRYDMPHEVLHKVRWALAATAIGEAAARVDVVQQCCRNCPHSLDVLLLEALKTDTGVIDLPHDPSVKLCHPAFKVVQVPSDSGASGGAIGAARSGGGMFLFGSAFTTARLLMQMNGTSPQEELLSFFVSSLGLMESAPAPVRLEVLCTTCKKPNTARGCTAVAAEDAAGGIRHQFYLCVPRRGRAARACNLCA